MTKSRRIMPCLFLAHGSPMNAVESNRFTDDWSILAGNMPQPDAIVVISAHWQTPSPMVTSTHKPATIHDYRGGSQALRAIRYRCPGAPDLAQQMIQRHPEISADSNRGLDHGSWTLLNKLYPAADIPTLQLSLATDYYPQQHIALAQQLRWLRDNNTLLIGSGNIVHNIGYWMAWAQGKVTNTRWAHDFDQTIFEAICSQRLDILADYQAIDGAALAVPTDEHYLPLLYAAAIADTDDTITTSQFTSTGFEADCSRSIRFG
ncbi:4,5-DOPA dioxygenase extradiol [Sinobacterium norvegicum]|uniref:4,5-DOPA dioxygenase extradiol n=1 Tax=Sinobacterium norvegicum TaxID=1641715 RepID=A0ABM9ABC5_9GAMM|nr:class III extradiol ring-cleavage dioxygenase [Sinobacterium norvegicum]CAH0990510.1 4,5-DOPA dioxygenase extradiol [Sinobacterium norvegicum]